MKILQNIRFYLVITLLCLGWLWVIYVNQKQTVTEQQATIENLNNQVDSLNTELFNESNQCGRYELGLEYLKEIDSNSHKKVEYYISHETE